MVNDCGLEGSPWRKKPGWVWVFFKLQGGINEMGMLGSLNKSKDAEETGKREKH